MNDSTKLTRLYDEKDVARLLKRATELQREDPVQALGSAGMSLAELEEIAAEAGIDPRHLRRAADELDTPEMAGMERVLGERHTLVFEDVVPGEIPEASFVDLVGAVQEAAGDLGQPSLIGRALTWRSETPGKSRILVVTVASRNGVTRIRVEERLHQFASGLFAGTTAGVGVGLGVGAGVPLGAVMGSIAFSVAFPLGMVGLSYIGCRAIYRSVVGRRRKVLANVLERLSAAARDAIASATGPALPPS
jgi:hypothetical protein